MSVDPVVIPGLLLLAAELVALAAVGYVVARVALRQTNDLLALAQGLVIGLALWGLIVNFLLHLIPGMAGALAGWVVVVALGAGLAWRNRHALPIPPRTLAGFGLAGAAIFWIALASRQLLIIPDHILHTMVPATIRAGGWPPALGWNPDLDLAYHHGLRSARRPPDSLRRAPTWRSQRNSSAPTPGPPCVLLTAALLLRRGSWAGTLALMPLLARTTAPGPSSLASSPRCCGFPVPVGVPVKPACARRLAEALSGRPSNFRGRTEQHAVPPKHLEAISFALTYATSLCCAGANCCRSRTVVVRVADTRNSRRIPGSCGRNGRASRAHALDRRRGPRRLES